MSAIDSVATFRARVEHLEIGGVWDKFVAAGWKTYGTFAFACTVAPGTMDPAAAALFDTEVVLPLLGAKVHVDKAKLRRLHFEAYTFCAADTQLQMTRTEDDAPRKMPLSERNERWADLEKRLLGMRLEGHLEPSHALIDKCSDMFEQNLVRYVEWSDCTMRSQELVGHKSVPEFKIDPATRLLKAVETQQLEVASYRTDLLLKSVLQRRGLALDMAGVMSYTVHDRLVSFLFDEYMRTPIEGYARTTVDQLHCADREIWSMLSKNCRAGVRALPGSNIRPLEDKLDACISSTTVRMIVMGRPTSGRPSPSSPAARPEKRVQGGGDDDRLKRKNKEIADLQKKLKEAKQSGGGEPRGARKVGGKPRGGGGGGKGKSDTIPGRTTLPQALIGKTSRTAAGEPICYDYNLEHGCSNAKPGERCSKGFHVCMEPGCGKAHTLKMHR